MKTINLKQFAAAIYIMVSLLLVCGIAGGIENGSVTGWKFALVPVLLLNFGIAALVVNKVFNSKTE